MEMYHNLVRVYGLAALVGRCRCCAGPRKAKAEQRQGAHQIFLPAQCADKANGGRTRNLPENAPDKWASFKRYNARDVEVEISIQEKLAKFAMPDAV